MASSGKKPAKNTKSIQEEAHNPGVNQQGNEPLSRGERRRQQFEQKRIDRKQAPAKQQRDQKFLRYAGVALAVVVLVGVGYFIFNSLTTRDDNREPDGVVTFDHAGGNH